ncbi:hypothetical protein BOS5A_110213 [Bosea sp. EC-HK365B]|nr:hypothetical protein BOSE21B_50237 [Bosea sp. 21B]CAD5301472.1 hypothetical protein BOSE7B_90451 [Bosea sp. 7B]VVT51078.1 hypothetical protein BOS5A_110213 [Bosea sp. EC-HK365B]VXB70042.1 hypothetical protein BOSE127_140395 [Bosea sp. 127]
MFNDGSGHDENGLKIGRNTAAKPAKIVHHLIRAHDIDHGLGMNRSCIVDQYIDPTVPSNNPIYQRIYCSRISNVDFSRLNTFREGRQGFLVDIGSNYHRTPRQQMGGNGKPQSFGAAGDQCDLAFNLQRRSPSRSGPPRYS